jgi:hypothetical protein
MYALLMALGIVLGIGACGAYFVYVAARGRR